MRRKPARSGRNTIGRSEFIRNLAEVLRVSDVCGICGHGNAKTGDHIVPYSQWPTDAKGRPLPGLHAVTNIQPAHGTMGNTGAVNRCEPCRLANRFGRGLCNQSKKHRQLTGNPRSRQW